MLEVLFLAVEDDDGDPSSEEAVRIIIVAVTLLSIIGGI